MKKNILNVVFVFVIFTFLLAGLVRTVISPEEINEYENRKSVILNKPTINAFLDGSLQDNVEDAISDQAPFSEKMKKTHNENVSKYMKNVISSVAKRYPREYIKMGKFYLFDEDNILYGPYKFEDVQEKIDGAVDTLNNLYSKYENLDFYLYYIEKEIDIDFITGKKLGAFEYIKDIVDFKDENVSKFSIDSFSQYDERFYKTDHHWNSKGSYAGYQEIIKMILPDEENFIKILETVDVSPDFKGSKTQSEETATYSEKFWAYRYDYPEFNIIVNGEKAEDYGNQDSFFEGNGGELSYGAFFGSDYGEIVFDSGNKEKDNILIIGESHDNAILKLLASHFNKTVSIDLRYYEPNMAKVFSFSEYVEKYDIDKVLFVGSVGFYNKNSLKVEG